MHVLLYSQPYCKFCDKTKQFFAENNIPYDEVVLNTPEEKQAVVEKTGHKTRPVVVVDGTVVGGYTDMIEQLKNGKLVLNYGS